MDQGAWWAAVHGVAKSRTQLSDFTFTFHFHALEKEMATCSSILAGESHGQGSLEGYSPWGCKRVRQDLVTEQQQQIYWISVFRGRERADTLFKRELEIMQE